MDGLHADPIIKTQLTIIAGARNGTASGLGAAQVDAEGDSERGGGMHSPTASKRDGTYNPFLFPLSSFQFPRDDSALDGPMSYGVTIWIDITATDRIGQTAIASLFLSDGLVFSRSAKRPAGIRLSSTTANRSTTSIPTYLGTCLSTTSPQVVRS